MIRNLPWEPPRGLCDGCLGDLWKKRLEEYNTQLQGMLAWKYCGNLQNVGTKRNTILCLLVGLGITGMHGLQSVALGNQSGGKYSMHVSSPVVPSSRETTFLAFDSSKKINKTGNSAKYKAKEYGARRRCRAPHVNQESCVGFPGNVSADYKLL